MARVLIDINMFSDDWFKKILPELVSNRKVKFTYSEEPKWLVEISKVRDALRFFKTVGALKDESGASRRDDASLKNVEHHRKYIESQNCFCVCAACDDPHIFAMIYVKPTQFVFSKDLRIAVCRDNINKSIDSRYCKFIILHNSATYSTHKQKVHS